MLRLDQMHIELVRVQPDQGFVRVWGYCTHAQLKNNLNYNATWRTYALGSTAVTYLGNRTYIGRLRKRSFTVLSI